MIGPFANSKTASPYRGVTLIFALCALALCFPWLSGRVTIPWDAKAHVQAQFAFLAHALHAGQSPFWNPHVFAGMPQIADPQSLIFAPPYLITAALFARPSFILADAIVFAMLAMGAVALIGFFKDRRWSAGGALLAALVFAFGGSSAWRIQHTGQIMSLAWTPIALLMLSRALDAASARGHAQERRSLAYGVLAGLAAAMMALGRDQVAFLGVLLLAAYALYRLATDASLTQSVGPLAAGALAGALVMAMPLAMTLHLSQNSNRPLIDLEGAYKASLPPGSFFTLVSANMFGTDGPLKDFWGPPSSAFGTTDTFLARNMTNLYAGELPLVALVAALGRRYFAAKDIRFFAAAALFFTLYALGRHTPAYALFYHIPGVDLWRRPADATYHLGFMLAILSGYGLHLVERGEAAPRPALLVGVMLALLASAAAVAALKDHLAQAAPALALSALFAALAIAFVLAVARGALSGRALLVTLAALMGTDLALGNGPNESTALPPEQFDVLREETRDPVIAFLRAKENDARAQGQRFRVELAGVDFHWPNAPMAHGLDHDLGYNPLRLKIFADATNAGDHLALPEQRQFSKLYASYRSPLSDMLGLRYVASSAPLEAIDKNYKEGDFIELPAIGAIRLYENPRALPRVLVATCAMHVDFAKMIETGDWPEADFHETVLLEESPICHSRAGVAADAARARLLSYENTEIVVEATAPAGGGWLVLNDVWHPWWRATLDGAPAPILRANVLFRAVPITEGVHRIVFTFEPLQGLLARER